MAVTITDFGIEYNGQRRYNGAFIAGDQTGFKIWCIVEESTQGLRTADGYDWIVSGGGYFKTADSGGTYTSAYNASVIENWIGAVT